MDDKETLHGLAAIRKERMEKAIKMKQEGVNPYPHYFECTTTNKKILDSHQKLKPGEKTSDNVSIAGRIMTMRIMGKAGFADLLDASGKIQIYVRKDEIGDKSYSQFCETDIGDFFGVHGTVFRTKTGETSVWASDLVLLSKSIRPLPEKWHGLKDVEARYRMRYLDLLVNSSVRDIFKKRTEFIQRIRNYFISRGFLEVETPMMQTHAGGAMAKPFVTFHNALDMHLYMRIAPELYLKRLLVGGIEKVFELGRSFRNEGISTRHNPEFTMLEVYQAYIDYHKVMDMCEELITEVLGCSDKEVIEYQGKKIELKRPWPRVSLNELIKKYAGVDLEKQELTSAAKQVGIEITEGTPKHKILDHIFDQFAKEHLINPVFVTEWPQEFSPLAKAMDDDPSKAERFELYIGGLELANGYSELNDPEAQRRNMELQGDVDEDYVSALEYGMPPAGGLGIGIDRLVMLACNASSIRDVILFPCLRPRESL